MFWFDSKVQRCTALFFLSFFPWTNKLWQIILFQFLVKLLCPLYPLARSYFLPFWLIMKQIHAIFKPTIKCHLKFLSLKLWQIMLWQFHFFQFTIYFVPEVALLRSFFSFRLILPFLFFSSVFEVQLKICQICITHYKLGIYHNNLNLCVHKVK